MLLKNVGKDIGKNDGKYVGENVGEKTLEEQLINAIKNKPNISQREMATLIGKTTKTIERIIKFSNRIRRIGPNKRRLLGNH